MRETIGMLAAAGAAIAIAVFGVGCGTQDPFGREGEAAASTAAGESTPAQDAVAISNYISQTTILVEVSGDNNVVAVGDDNDGTRTNREEDNSVVNPAPVAPEPDEEAAE